MANFSNLSRSLPRYDLQDPQRKVLASSHQNQSLLDRRQASRHSHNRLIPLSHSNTCHTLGQALR